MSNDLVPFNPGDLDGPDGRRAALERLGQQAAEAAAPEDAHEIMTKGRTLAQLLRDAKAPYEEMWLAGKASVLAARRLGKLLGDLDNTPQRNGLFGGKAPSVRGVLSRELGIRPSAVVALVKLSRIHESHFQRYIQIRDHVPTVGGCLRSVGHHIGGSSSSSRSPRRRVGVKTPKNPSFDEGYSLIVQALGHLGAVSHRGGSIKRKTAIGAAMARLYEAEDLLKPYRGGYAE